MAGRITTALVATSLLLGGTAPELAHGQRGGRHHSENGRGFENRELTREERRQHLLRERENRQAARDNVLQRVGIDRQTARARLGIYDLVRQFHADGGTRASLTAFRASQASRAAEESGELPSTPHLYALFGRPANDRPDVATALFGPALRPGVAILSGIPETSQQFAKVFGKDVVASRNALDAVRAGSNALKRIEGTHAAIVTIDQVVEAIRSSRESTILLVGHNEGGILISPTGDRLSLGKIARSCARFGKLCVLLSCQAARHVPGAHGPTVDISPAQASRIAAKIAKALAEQPVRPLEAIVPAPVVATLVYSDPWRVVSRIDEIIANETTGRTRLFYVGLIVGGVIIVALVIVEMNGPCDDETTRCPS